MEPQQKPTYRIANLMLHRGNGELVDIGSVAIDLGLPFNTARGAFSHLVREEAVKRIRRGTYEPTSRLQAFLDRHQETNDLVDQKVELLEDEVLEGIALREKNPVLWELNDLERVTSDTLEKIRLLKAKVSVVSEKDRVIADQQKQIEDLIARIQKAREDLKP